MLYSFSSHGKVTPNKLSPADIIRSSRIQVVIPGFFSKRFSKAIFEENLFFVAKRGFLKIVL
jgi:hypothetical protein